MGVKMGLNNKNIQEKDNLLKQLKIMSEESKLYIVGAGRYGDILGKWLNQNEIKWSGYLDRSKDNREINGKKIFNILEVKDENNFYVISSPKYRDEMKAELAEQGISEKKIISPKDMDLLIHIYDDTDNWRKYTEKCKKFSRCHQNSERCFIIGNGPSLRIEDLEMLRNEITFAANTIYGVYGSTDWRPSYYCSVDTTIWNTLGRDEIIEKILSSCEAAFASPYGSSFEYKEDEEFKNLYYVMPVEQKDSDTQYSLFAEECSDIVNICGTVTYIMMQLAVYMGFKKIYLLGIDFTFSHEKHGDNSIKINNISNHMEQIEKEQERFYEVLKKKYGYNYMASVDQQKEAYMSAKKYADEHGIKIYNATRGGKLEVFERVDFDTLFAE